MIVCYQWVPWPYKYPHQAFWRYFLLLLCRPAFEFCVIFQIIFLDFIWVPPCIGCISIVFGFVIYRGATSAIGYPLHNLWFTTRRCRRISHQWQTSARIHQISSLLQTQSAGPSARITGKSPCRDRTSMRFLFAKGHAIMPPPTCSFRWRILSCCDSHRNCFWSQCSEGRLYKIV